VTSGWKATDYTDLATLKAHLRIGDTDDDAALAIAITAASRAIDLACNRQFGITGSAVPRVYTYIGQFIERRSSLAIDDLQDLTTGPAAFAFDLNYDGIFETTVELGVDFDLWPWNAPANGEPYKLMVMRPITKAYFPRFTRGIQVTANWGWEAVPTVVAQAALIQAARFFVRRDSAYGVAGSPDLGNELRLFAQLDPDVRLMLQTVARQWAAS
jgi:hypothetical protein